MSFCADFETTTNPNDCRVWAFGVVDIENTDNFIYGNSIDDFMLWCQCQESETLYFHNLKFDGEFIFYWLFKNNFKHSASKTFGNFNTIITDKGQFYAITIYFQNNYITIYDSFKIIPFRVKDIAKSFNLIESKLEIDYHRERPKGYLLSQNEIGYLKNDVVIVAKALKMLFSQNLKKMTLGSNALFDFKKTLSKKDFSRYFPTPTLACDMEIRQSYKGGWTYLNPRYENLDVGNGVVLDVNSLYPSVMLNALLPYGEGIHFNGKYETDKVYNLYTQLFTCQFEIKPNHLPTIQLKNSTVFSPTQYVTSSEDSFITLCLTSVDIDLFFMHYNVFNITWQGGWKFKSTDKLFKDYINKWATIKINAEKNKNLGMRTLAKLMLNNLYGKFATNPNIQSKIPYLDEDSNIIKYALGEKETKEPIYIPVGSFITAWARYKTITSAQKNYRRFIYADTDSLHLEGLEMPKDIEIDETEIGAWKIESTFTRGRFIRAKTYAEEIEGKMHITCAGMPDSCHNTVNWDNFKKGTSYSGKLQHTHVKGGIILKNIDFTIKI